MSEVSGAPWANSTRITTSLDCARLEKSPGDIDSDRPVVELPSLCCWPHSGPPGRGNSTNRMAASGSACSSSTTDCRSRVRTPTSAWLYCMVSSTASSAGSTSSVQSPIRMPCECRYAASSRKKHRKTVMKKSRRVRISSSFMPRNSSTSATPASCPTSVRNCAYTAPTTARLASIRTTRPGSGRPDSSSPSRQQNSSAKPAVHQKGR